MKESINLSFREGSSDKVYQATLEEKGNGCFVVNFQYGRRGASLTSGTKTNDPVPYDKAKKVYDKLVQEKVAKGYKPDGSAPTAIATVVKALDNRNTGMLPQLLNPIEESELQFFMDSNDYGMQEKHDGRRLMVKKEGSKITAANRKGQEIPLKQEFLNELSCFDGDFIIDGEDCGTHFYVFDCLQYKDVDISQSGYSNRWWSLVELMRAVHSSDNCIPQKYVHVSPLIKTSMVKQAELKELKRKNAEGVVFKVLSAPYSAGRPNSGGSQRKFKFVATCTCRVAGRNGTKRSVSLQMCGGVDVGNVTIPANHDIPNVGDLVEIRYLYYFKGGSLFQPVYLGYRDDIDHPDSKESLKVKADGGDDE